MTILRTLLLWICVGKYRSGIQIAYLIKFNACYNYLYADAVDIFIDYYYKNVVMAINPKIPKIIKYYHNGTVIFHQ